MCLNNAKLRYATKPIKCYKYLDKNLKPIYYDFQYELGKVCESELRCERILSFIPIQCYDYTKYFIIEDSPNYIRDCRLNSYFVRHDLINARYIHSNCIAEGFHTYKEPVKDIVIYTFQPYNLYECEIPAYSWYYEGEYGTSVSYASDHLIVKKLYKPDET